MARGAWGHTLKASSHLWASCVVMRSLCVCHFPSLHIPVISEWEGPYTIKLQFSDKHKEELLGCPRTGRARESCISIVWIMLTKVYAPDFVLSAWHELTSLLFTAMTQMFCHYPCFTNERTEFGAACSRSLSWYVQGKSAWFQIQTLSYHTTEQLTVGWCLCGSPVWALCHHVQTQARSAGRARTSRQASWL